MIRKCLECGGEFQCSPSDKIVTCSKECSRRRRSRLMKGRRMSSEARKNMSEARKGQYTENLKKGTPAAQASPKAGRFETNASAKEWVLLSPDGEYFRCVNLRHFIREHPALFGISPTDAEVDRIVSGIKAIKYNIKNGKRGTTYHGWTLAMWDDRENYEKNKTPAED